MLRSDRDWRGASTITVMLGLVGFNPLINSCCDRGVMMPDELWNALGLVDTQNSYHSTASTLAEMFSLLGADPLIYYAVMSFEFWNSSMFVISDDRHCFTASACAQMFPLMLSYPFVY